MKRIFLVYNPRSSRFCDVKKEVLDKLPKLKGYVIGKFEVEPTDVDQNASVFAKLLKDGDLVISAGGDATGIIASNAILKSNKNVTLAVLPYGNFNDLSRTLGINNFDDIFHHSSIDYYPLEIYIDDKFFRYATCYVTIGMTAEAVPLFDEPKIRKNLQKGHKSSWRSYLYLVRWYFKHRHKKTFIPEFKLNGRLQPKKTSDYAAVNGSSMCRVMKGGQDYLAPKTFRSMTDRLTNFWRLFKLMVKSIWVRTPGNETEGDLLEFLKPSTVSLQAEGEYKTFENINRIEIKKSKKCLKMIQNS